MISIDIQQNFVIYNFFDIEKIIDPLKCKKQKYLVLLNYFQYIYIYTTRIINTLINKKEKLPSTVKLLK